MASGLERAFRVLEFHSTKSVVGVQRAFRSKYEKISLLDILFVNSTHSLQRLV